MYISELNFTELKDILTRIKGVCSGTRKKTRIKSKPRYDRRGYYR